MPLDTSLAAIGPNTSAAAAVYAGDWSREKQISVLIRRHIFFFPWRVSHTPRFRLQRAGIAIGTSSGERYAGGPAQRGRGNKQGNKAHQDDVAFSGATDSSRVTLQDNEALTGLSACSMPGDPSLRLSDGEADTDWGRTWVVETMARIRQLGEMSPCRWWFQERDDKEEQPAHAEERRKASQEEETMRLHHIGLSRPAGQAPGTPGVTRHQVGVVIRSADGACESRLFRPSPFCFGSCVFGRGTKDR
ncbi:hypothetical protein DL762_004341 [Monosporascus cannonballus]|uniref:Uncharacterized protein n=1 Tax=Monosporascus cannonballus TaxID=155416 RepID=A0ABY0H961_9PEZI|nr:hypothetical protein DL762_004341 [Monosporascus cannonballus]